MQQILLILQYDNQNNQIWKQVYQQYNIYQQKFIMSQSKCLSPTKENLSPSKLKSQQKYSELINFVKNSGLKLPNHFEKSINHGDKIRLIPTENAETNPSEKKLKVKISDIEFQLKKTEEDFAQFKRNSRMQKEKEIKKWEEAYNQLKTNLQENSEDSSIKIIRLREANEKQVTELKSKHKAQMKQQIQTLRENYESKFASQQKLNEREVKELTQKHKRELTLVQQKYEAELKDQKSCAEFEMRKVMMKNKEILETREKQYESIYIALQSEKKTQEKLHEKTKIEANQAKQKLYSDLYYERNLKKDLQEVVAKREKKIKELKIEIKDLEACAVVEKERGEKKLKEVISDFQRRIIGIEQLHKEEKVKMYSCHTTQLSKLQKTIKEINEWKNDKENLLKEKMVELEAKFDERPSRKEDLQTIDRLKGKIQKKEDENKILRKELKTCALEIENKEETYNRIFVSSCAKREKKSLNKEREDLKSKESLCRKSQTTDLKFLLKVYNKHI